MQNCHYLLDSVDAPAKDGNVVFWQQVVADFLHLRCCSTLKDSRKPLTANALRSLPRIAGDVGLKIALAV